MKYLLIVFGFLFSIHSTQGNSLRVLFLGNSYTYVNDLPLTFKQVANAMGDSVYVDSYAQGGYNLQLLSTDAAALAKIQLGNWDYVIIQAQSQEPSFDPSQVQTDTYPYAHILDSMVNANNSCAETMFYMTWGRKNGDASNCAVYPPICTYAGMQQRLRESYLEMAQNNHGSVAPVGVAWKHVRDTNPTIELYQADESHPSIYGTYLAACVFYSSIFHKSAIGCSYVYPGISSPDASVLQTTAGTTVLDSIENWQQHGDIPLAMFSVSTNNNVLNTTNSSMRYNNLIWDFGDGTNSTLTTPSHTYTNNGFYTVQLSVTNACGKVDVKKVGVNIGSPNSVNAPVEKDRSVSFIGHEIRVRAVVGDHFILTDAYGRKIMDHTMKDPMEWIHVENMVKGIFFYELIGENQRQLFGKLLLNED